MVREPLHRGDVSEQNAAGLLPSLVRALGQDLGSDFSFLLREDGWLNPRQQAKGDISVEETDRLLKAYSTHRREATQELGDPSTRQRRDFSNS